MIRSNLSPPASAPDPAAPAPAPGKALDRGPVLVAAGPGEMDSLAAFFQGLGPDSGASLLLVLSLAPADPEAWTRDLATRIPLPLERGRAGSVPTPGRILLVLPDPPLGLDLNGLTAVGPGPSRRTVDRLFRSLARERGVGALAVLLAGTGLDGIRGGRAVRDRGGRVLVQDPRTARFPAMPYRMALAGLGDRLRPPGELAEELRRHLLQDPAPELPPGPGPVGAILDRMLDRAGVDFHSYRSTHLLRRIGHRMRCLGYHDLLRYHTLLEQDPREAGRLLQELLVNATSFFRNPGAFRELQERVVAPLVRSHPPGLPIRIWVPGCATGEEAYSLAILVLEEQARQGRTEPLRVYATDIDPEGLDWGRRGWFPGSIAGPVGPARFAAFFQPAEAGGCRVAESLRRAVIFARHDLLADPPLCGMDLVSCRNLLSYLDPEARPRILALLNFALVPGGALFLGLTEHVRCAPDLFRPLSARTRIYRRIGPTEPRPGADPEQAPVLGDLISANESLHRALDAAKHQIEDLQAANEGLMIAAEEAQAASEELATANGVLQLELERSLRNGAELGDLVQASGLAAMVLDEQQRIRGFTPAMARCLRLAPGDRGRPLEHLGLAPNRDALWEALRAALAGAAPEPRRITLAEGLERLLQVRRCPPQDGRTSDLVITLEAPGPG